MKIEETVGSIQLSPNIKLRRFSIAANQRSFKQLYGGLYSYEIKAIIRELSTNAADAHVSAGKTDVPFDVHLPNELEPFFFVKDYGTGLSPTQIMGDLETGESGIYTTFFDSDKADSDDFTGCLGLGSKSPFAYTDNFTVESRHNGKKYLYACLHNEKGEPCIAPMGETETDEPNGLKIEFAVKEQDFHKFYNNASEVLTWFKLRPNVVGYPDFKFEEHKYLRKSERYGVCKQQSESFVIMGNVAYPVNAGDLYYSAISDVDRQVIQHGVHLFVDIGDVEFVPSREKLKMSDKTIAGVKKYLGEAIKSIQEELEAQVEQQPSVWKARRMLHEIKHSILGKVRSMTTVHYNGKEISEYVKFKKEIKRDQTGAAIKDAFGSYSYEPTPTLEVISLKKEHYRRRNEDTLYCNDNRIYLVDMERGSHARILKNLRDNGVDQAYIVSLADPNFLAETGIGEVAIPASTLPQPERKAREKRDGSGISYSKRTVMQEYVPTSMSGYWRDVDVDLREGGIYVLVSYGQILEGNAKIAPDAIRHKYNLMKQLDPTFRLLGIRPCHLGKIGKYQHRWSKFDDYARALLVANEALKEQALLAVQETNREDRWQLFMNTEFDASSKFGQFIQKYRKVVEAKKDTVVKAFTDLNEIMEVFEIKDEVKAELQSAEQVIAEAYPLLEELNWYRSHRSQFAEMVTDYIRGVDSRVSQIVPLQKVV